MKPEPCSLSICLAATIVAGLVACERKPVPSLEIDEPKTNVVGNTVTFRWHLEPAAPSERYRFEILLDKGMDPCDGDVEESFDADSSTCKTISLDRNRFHPGARAEWAISASAPGREWQCVRGGKFTVDATLPPAAPCNAGR